MELRLLGPLEILHGGREYVPDPPKARQMFALLATRAGSVVSVDSLIEELWGEQPPRSATSTLQTYVYLLRKLFDELATDGRGDGIVVTRSPGYLLDADKGMIDAHRFEQGMNLGRAKLREGDPHGASAVLGEVLGRWRGRPLENVVHGRLLESYAVHLEERRIEALQLRILADLRIERHRELVGELRSLVLTYPLNEWFYGRLMEALNRSGRRGEALAVYQNLHRVLHRELGVEPSAEVQRVWREVMAAHVPTSALTADS